MNILKLVVEGVSEEQIQRDIIDNTRLRYNWYKVCILCYNGDIITGKLRLKEDNIHFDFRDIVRYIGNALIDGLNQKRYDAY